MIEWIEFTVKKPEEEGKYLVSDGNNVDVADYMLTYNDDIEDYECKWYPSDLSPLDNESITHWVLINLPGEA
ncbi:hypothetical protein MMB75_05085 [Paenibacillus sp. P2(2022)]|jgi:hypothetical protein|uniref:hypothetical protein n=1 Tax=Paenibacillus TaxID=44249 RepID=UPI0007E92730|nr:MULTISPECIES: hypothetical protein [Paenibacillus]MBY0020760.1 hypothetical protein [Paenibacillus polymyxa]MBY0059064.1 hypothetical protein [Paenibacillus polymyxa]MBY0069651.1 hypothetical protein [Paenibacillus polymyxa]MBY0083268.1 hypothetical protein [Paenibacillus polymyxa]MBZ6441832.1 hypothetical protein [Paenibacillus polymyxa]